MNESKSHPIILLLSFPLAIAGALLLYQQFGLLGLWVAVAGLLIVALWFALRKSDDQRGDSVLDAAEDQLHGAFSLIAKIRNRDILKLIFNLVLVVFCVLVSWYFW